MYPSAVLSVVGEVPSPSLAVPPGGVPAVVPSAGPHPLPELGQRIGDNGPGQGLAEGSIAAALGRGPVLHSLCCGKLRAEEREVVDRELMLINQVFPGGELRALSLDVRKRIVQARFHGLEGVFVALKIRGGSRA